MAFKKKEEEEEENKENSDPPFYIDSTGLSPRSRRKEEDVTFLCLLQLRSRITSGAQLTTAVPSIYLMDGSA